MAERVRLRIGESPYWPGPNARRTTRTIQRAIQKAQAAPTYADHSVVQAVASVLGKSSRFHQRGAAAVLEPYASSEAVSLALQLVARGTATRPNARLAEHGIGPESAQTALIRQTREREVYSRAAYLVNAAVRMDKAISEGATPRQALAREERHRKSHEKARKGRLLASAQVQKAGGMFGWPTDEGTLVGWYHNPFLNNDTECLAASGNNFYIERGTIIGLPGSVHPNCGCYAGPPHVGGGMVNEEVTKVVNLADHRRKFVLRKKRGA